MELLENLLKDKGADWIGMLVEKAGMDRSQAEAFVPIAVGAIGKLLQGGQLDVGSLLGGGGAGALLGQLDLGALAGGAGVDRSTAEAGVEQLAPEVLGSLKDRAGGLEGLMGALGGEGSSGDLLGAAGSLGKKLFG
jgi:hypothetical protein